MATASQLPHLLTLLRRYLLRILARGAYVLSPALVRILQRLPFLWSFFRSRWNSWRKSKGTIDGPPSSPTKSPIGPPRKEPEPVKPSKEDALRSELELRTDEYTIIPDGETISLDDAAFSLYPFAGGIHNASRSSHILSASRSAHNLAITTRNASRSSRVGSPYSNSAYSVSNIDAEESITITIQPTSPRSPAPRRQYSLSSPELHHNQATSSRPRPSSPIQLEEFSSPRDISDITSLNIPDVSTRPASPVTTCLANERITPLMPEGTQRYTRRPRIRKECTEMTIQPLTITLQNPLPPPGWTKHIHPEGVRYFFNEKKRIYTEADLYDPNILTQAEEDITTLENFISTEGINLPENTDLVIDLYYDEGKMIQTTYYYVDHTSRTIFFLDTYEANTLDCWYQIQGANTESHLRHAVDAQYWYYVQLYPSSLKMSAGLVSELRDVILHCIADSMTSPTSTAPYTLDNLYKILPLTDSLESNIGHQCVGAVSFLARQMFIFTNSKFLDFHGEAHARLERGFSVHGTPIHQRTILIKTLSLFLFSAPDFHLRTLQDMWVDGIMHKSVWEQSMQKMIQEWQEFVLFATVMLNANVGFLAINSVDTNRPDRSPAQISSYVSVVASIGSIVLGLLLIRQNRTKNRETVDEVQNYLALRSHPRLGLETLAILHSLPYALLMWGMVSFMLAFSFECFQSASTETQAVVGSLCLVVAVLVAWAVWTSWEKHSEDQAVEPPLAPMKSDAGSSHNSVKQKEAKPTILSRVLGPVRAFLVRRQTADSERTVFPA